MRKLLRSAPAKVNLGLRVLGRRPDGYHELQTVYQTISLADEVEVSVEAFGSSAVDLHCERKDLENKANLAWRAATQLLSRLGIQAQVRIRLRKRIPIAAGLGGGSSDAAAVLLALAELLPEPPPHADLMAIASSLGSDVPFFLDGGAAIGTGRGTELSPLPDLPATPVVLVLPGIEVSTSWAYRALSEWRVTELTQTTETGTMERLFSDLGRLGTGAVESLSGLMINDFESVVFQRFPALAAIKRQLLACGARPALMSGSGSTMFGIFESNRAARNAVARLEASGLRALAVRFLTRAECRTAFSIDNAASIRSAPRT